MPQKLMSTWLSPGRTVGRVPPGTVVYRAPAGDVREAVAMERSEEGIDLEVVKLLKEVQRRRIKEYLERRPKAKFIDKGSIWEIPCQVAISIIHFFKMIDVGKDQGK